MRICLIGDFSAELDEGFKNVTRYLERYLSRDHELLQLDLKRPLDPAFWLRRLPEPDVIHYLSAPTLPAFALLGLLRLRWPGVPRVVSALHPSSLGLANSLLLRGLVRLSSPTLVLVQGSRSEAMFRELGRRVEFLPNGVSTERFVPLPEDVRRDLRNKHGLETGKYLVLHVGHLSRKRNIQLMSRLQTADTQVLIVGSTYLGEDKELSASLEDQGCIVWRGYVPQIEQVYAIADCFVLPTSPSGSLFMPLSVLEAMACNLPVVSTPFEGLLRYFEPGDGLIYSEESEIPAALERWRQGGFPASTRRKVEAYSWDDVVRRLEAIYKGLMDGSRA